MSKKKLGDMLVELGKITPEQLEQSLSNQKGTNYRLGEQLVHDNIISELDMLQALSMQLNIDIIDLDIIEIDKKLFKNLKREFLERKHFIPVKKEADIITVAVADVLDLQLLEDLEVFLNSSIAVRIASKKKILEKVEQIYAIDKPKKEEDTVLQKESLAKNINLDDLEVRRAQRKQSLESDPVVKLVENIFKDAIAEGASDIHIEPFADSIRIRNRVDGRLREKQIIQKNKLSAISTRIKIIGNMDISEKRKPQDGRVETAVGGKPIDLRISILPTIHGEKIVIRLLERESLITDLKELGFTARNLILLEKMQKAPQGMILVTGPTGSGKTTTLYSLLKSLNNEEANVITVEDPVEYQLEGINQVQVNKKAGLSFSSGLRSILRQDPDIIMLGEIRDQETADIALRASITGHLVLSTLHTNDTAATVSRLLDMGAKSYVLSSSLVGIIAQRLTARLCTCKKSHIVTKKEAQFLDTIEEGDEVMNAGGCELCNYTGYKGRIAIHEMMVIEGNIRNLINEEATSDIIKQVAIENGMHTLKSEGEYLVKQGLTSIDEVMKVAYTL